MVVITVFMILLIVGASLTTWIICRDACQAMREADEAIEYSRRVRNGERP